MSRYWVLFEAEVEWDEPVHIPDVGPTERWNKAGRDAMVALMKNERVQDVASFGGGGPGEKLTFGLSGTVEAINVFGAIGLAAEEFFPIFVASFEHEPTWTNVKVKRLSDA